MAGSLKTGTVMPPTRICGAARKSIGYEIMATDGTAGTVENFIFDDADWMILYLVVETRKWLPGKDVLLPPRCVASVSWSEHEVYVNATRRAVETSREYDASMTLSRKGEADVHEQCAGSDIRSRS